MKTGEPSSFSTSLWNSGFVWAGLRPLWEDKLALTGAVVLVFLLGVAILAPTIAPYDPLESIHKPGGGLAYLQPPSWSHPLGTNNLGRDLLSQVMVGARVALIVGFLAAFLVTLVGTTVALLAGYFRGWVDDFLMRMVDVAYSIPLEPLAIVVLSFLKPSIWNIILVVAVLAWRDPARVIRAQVLSLVERPFVKAARVSGAGDLRIIFFHIAPNILALSHVYVAIAFGWAVIAETGISFLGFGDPRTISWGQILHQAFLSGAIRRAWWWAVPPGVCIMLTVMSVFFIGRAYEEVLNPRLRKR
jgi:peptide/nickel transport system permease protein